VNLPATAKSLEDERGRALERDLSRVFDRAARREKVRALGAFCRESREREYAERGIAATF
jgi:hypothetical protein